MFAAYFVWQRIEATRFAPERLRGLTPDQVITRLGAPTTDTRKSYPDVGPQPPGKFSLGYFRAWGDTYRVDFEQDRVVDVQHFVK